MKTAKYCKDYGVVSQPERLLGVTDIFFIINDIIVSSNKHYKDLTYGTALWSLCLRTSEDTNKMFS